MKPKDLEENNILNKPLVEHEEYFKHKPRRIREWWKNLYNSLKSIKMTRGSLNMFKTFSFARNENWRRNTQRSEKKYGHK